MCLPQTYLIIKAFLSSNFLNIQDTDTYTVYVYISVIRQAGSNVSDLVLKYTEVSKKSKQTAAKIHH